MSIPEFDVDAHRAAVNELYKQLKKNMVIKKDIVVKLIHQQALEM